MKLPKIVGIAGTNASGKDTLGELRAKLSGAQMVSLSNILREELDRRGISHERKNLGALGDEWRTEFGFGVLAEKTIAAYRESGSNKGISLTSIRHPEEARAIKKHGGIIIWVDADRRVRYDRINNRPINRIEDKVTFEEFCAQEDAEMQPNDINTMDMGAVKALADVYIDNDFSSPQAYEAFLVKEFEFA